MGFLRKIGKKIKKGVKKLMGGTFGKILGGVGLAMMFWGGANAMFGNMDWFKNLSTRVSKVKPFGNTSIGETISTLDKAKFGDLGVGQKIAKAGVEVGKGFYTAGESIGETIAKPFTGDFSIGDTVADVAEAGIKQTALTAIQGEPEEQTAGFGRMPSVGSFEAPQASYVAEVRNQMPNLQATDFQQLNQSLFYGTLSPQYLIGQMG
tara:strand:- start:770 stop:1390 length:621 start_codon:yes stop_codon:yes gene_type:complete